VRVRGDKVIAMYIPHLPLSLWERVGVRVREKKGRYVQ